MTAMMLPLPEMARVNPGTVSDYSEGVRHFPKRRKLRSVQAGAEMTTFQVHPLIWRDALREAKGDAHRIEIHSTTSVTVHL